MKYTIGIDFGISNTVLKAAIRDSDAGVTSPEPVTFTQQRFHSTPSLICRRGNMTWYGQEAAWNAQKDAAVFRNFKPELNAEEPARRQEVETLLEDFFRFLFRTFTEQKTFLVGDAEEGETVVGFPAGWGKDAQGSLLRAARNAGFPNVTGMDEPSAAIVCVLKARQQELERAGLLLTGKPLNVLTVDMGAVTTELAFVRVTADGDEIQTEIRETWPKPGSSEPFGGELLDLRLHTMVKQWLKDSGLSETLIENLITEQRDNIRSWKENTVSPMLTKGMPVMDFPTVSNILNMMGLHAEPFPVIDRDSFAAFFQPELEQFAALIASAPQKLREETELVILTGGGSDWFWAPEILSGQELRFGDVGLTQLRGAPDRVIRMEQPADTVSAGLVSGRGDFRLRPLLRYDPKSRIRPVIAAGTLHTVGVRSDGTVLAVGDNRWGQCGVSGWRDVVSVAAGFEHTVGLKADGTVLAAGSNGLEQCSVSGWTDIVAVAAGKWRTVGLKADGTVVSTGNKRSLFEDWQDIVAIAAGCMHTVGLKADGTVVAVGLNLDNECSVSEWQGIVAVAAGDYHTVGLKADGTVVAVGSNDHEQCSVEKWRNMIAVAAGDDTTVGLTDEGRTGNGVWEWHDVIAIAAGGKHIVGLKADGTVTATGENDRGQLSVGYTLKYSKEEPALLGLTTKTVWYTRSQDPWKLF